MAGTSRGAANHGRSPPAGPLRNRLVRVNVPRRPLAGTVARRQRTGSGPVPAPSGHPDPATTGTRAWPDGDAALGAVLGPILVPQFPWEAGDLPADQDLATVQVDVGPAQPAHLTTAGSEHDGQDQEQPQLRVLGQSGVSISRSAWATWGGWMSGRRTAGRVTSVIGLWSIQPQTWACLNAPARTACTSRTALAVMGSPRMQSVGCSRSRSPGRGR
jgi:hypothetical protein